MLLLRKRYAAGAAAMKQAQVLSEPAIGVRDQPRFRIVAPATPASFVQNPAASTGISG